MDFYTEDELLKLYNGKVEELGRLPTVLEVNNDPEMPSYSTILRKIGGKKIFLQRLDVQMDFSKVKTRFCKDCVYDPRDCGRDYTDCIKEADLYFQLLDKNSPGY